MYLPRVGEREGNNKYLLNGYLEKPGVPLYLLNRYLEKPGGSAFPPLTPGCLENQVKSLPRTFIPQVLEEAK
jgi:hypothetical protein